MDARWVTVGGGAALVVVLFAGWWRMRGEVARLRARLETASMELQRLQIAFARFTPHDVVERIIARGVATTADKKEVTVLFADLVSFTRLSEHLDPAVLVDILNGYFARMSRMVTEHRGHVSKFIGDGMLALFGALEANPWQANDAAHAALAMQAELERYNRELAAASLPPLRMGIGLHRGVAVAGVVGSHELMEFTVIGNTVNLAARVERLTRVHQVGILVTQAVQEVLDSRFVLHELPAAPIRGITDPVVTFAVERFEP